MTISRTIEDIKKIVRSSGWHAAMAVSCGCAYGHLPEPLMEKSFPRNPPRISAEEVSFDW